MPYKIVETLEKGKNTLFFVPNNWEQNNILHWPKWKVETLLAEEDSCPDSSWHAMKCRVKRTGLVSKASAEAELNNMLEKSDTEVEEFTSEKSKPKKAADKCNMNTIQEYFDDISKTCTIEYDNTPEPRPTSINESSMYEYDKMPEPQSTSIKESLVYEYDKTPEPQSTSVNASSIYVTCIPGPLQSNSTCGYVGKDMIRNLNIAEPSEPQSDSLKEAVYVIGTPQENSINNYVEQNNKIDTLIAIAGTLTQNQAVIMDYLKNLENKVLHKLSYLSTQIDTFVTMSSKSQGKENNVFFKCIGNKQELQTLEKNLEDTEFRAETKQRLLSVCGKGKGRGLNNAYTLADVIFTRQFLTECSWAGGSKNNTEKICFKYNTKIIDLFFELVHESDKNFTKKECESFFKNIMRHAVTRNKIEIKRAASCKRRSHKNVNNQPADRPTTDNQNIEILVESCEYGSGDNVTSNNNVENN